MRVKINGDYYDFFSEVLYTKALDQVAATFSLKCSFDARNKVHRELFTPLAYNNVEIFSDSGKLLLNGYILNSSFKSSAKPEVVTLTGYAKSGVLEDVNIPLISYPLEKNGMSLLEITESVLKWFDVEYSFTDNVSDEMNEIYEKAVATPTEKIAAYLGRLAKQRNVILTSTNEGNIRFYRLDTSAENIKYSFSKENTLTASLSVKGQGIHSDITVVRQQSLPFLGFEEFEDEIISNEQSNDLVDAYRPRVIQLEDGAINDVSSAASSYIASEMRNISLTITIEGLIDISEGDFVDYQNEEVYLLDKVVFVVSEVTFLETAKVKKTTLKLYLPEAYSGGETKRIFGGWVR